MMSGIEDLLRRHIGLEASTIGASTVEGVVRARMALVGVESAEEYLLRLRDSPAELHELVEAVVVPESWFFRDGAPFSVLAHWAQDQWLPKHPGATLRVLTVPCSTGEEPYSVAMTLLSAGLPPDRFTVDAVDISHRAVARARRGIYGQNSFRGQALDFRDHYFTLTPEGYVLAPEVQQPVRFAHGNLLAENFRPGAGRFDVIFCRNVLIYFDRPTQARAVRTLAGMLAPDGLLFVGHAETSTAVTAGFTSANFPMAFAFRKAVVPPPLLDTHRSPVTTKFRYVTPRPPRVSPPTTARVSAPKPPATRFLPTLASPPPAHKPAPAEAHQLPAPPASSTILDAARGLADQGKLTEAGRLCEDHLRQHGSSAAAWYLLGVVRDAAGDHRRAVECYAKTLYLEPDHQEALLQRALLAEGSGDLAAATQFRRRIARVQERSVRP